MHASATARVFYVVGFGYKCIVCAMQGLMTDFMPLVGCLLLLLGRLDSYMLVSSFGLLLPS